MVQDLEQFLAPAERRALAGGFEATGLRPFGRGAAFQARRAEHITEVRCYFADLAGVPFDNLKRLELVPHIPEP
jgi:hypothetical protein